VVDGVRDRVSDTESVTFAMRLVPRPVICSTSSLE